MQVRTHHCVVHGYVVPNQRCSCAHHVRAGIGLSNADLVGDHAITCPHHGDSSVQPIAEGFEIWGRCSACVMRGNEQHFNAELIANAVRQFAMSATCVEHRKIVKAQCDDATTSVNNRFHLDDDVVNGCSAAGSESD